MQVNKDTLYALAEAINSKSFAFWTTEEYVRLNHECILVKRVADGPVTYQLFINNHSVGVIDLTKDPEGLVNELRTLLGILLRPVTLQHAQNIIDEWTEVGDGFNKYGFKISKSPIETSGVDLWKVWFNDTLTAQIPWDGTDSEQGRFMVSQVIKKIVSNGNFGDGFVCEILPGEILIKNTHH